MEKLLNVKQAALELNVCRRTVFNYIRQGILKTVKIGGQKKAGRIYISADQIDKILRKR